MDQDVVLMYGKREDRVIYLDLTDQFAGALGFASALSLDYLLDEAAPAARRRGRRQAEHQGRAAAVRRVRPGSRR